jgi:predicted nucleotidyltransferase
MIDLLYQQRERLRELCLRHGVARLGTFGSAAREDFDPTRSDLDFLIEFQSAPSVDRFAQFFGFKEDLEALFGRSVDLVMVGALRNPYFIQGVNESRVLLYAA